MNGEWAARDPADRLPMLMDVADLVEYMRAYGIAGEVIRLPEHTPTVEAAARVVGTTADRIVKSIVFLAGVAPLLVIANGTRRLDPKLVAGHLGLSRRRVQLAGAAAVLELTGFEVGTMPPFGHRTRLRTLMDIEVLAQPEVYAGGGAIDALLRITPAEILRATGAETVRVVKENER